MRHCEGRRRPGNGFTRAIAAALCARACARAYVRACMRACALAALVLCMQAGCGPSKVLAPPTSLPRELQGRRLWHTPMGYIYARDKVIAGETDRWLRDLDGHLRRTYNLGLTKGLVIVTDLADEGPSIASLADMERYEAASTSDAASDAVSDAVSRTATLEAVGAMDVLADDMDDAFDAAPSDGSSAEDPLVAESVAEAGDEPDGGRTVVAASRPSSQPVTSQASSRSVLPPVSSQPSSQPSSQASSRPSEADRDEVLAELGLSESEILRIMIVSIGRPQMEDLGLAGKLPEDVGWAICCPSHRQARKTVRQIADEAIEKELGLAARIMVAPLIPIAAAEAAKAMDLQREALVFSIWATQRMDWSAEERRAQVNDYLHQRALIVSPLLSMAMKQKAGDAEDGKTDDGRGGRPDAGGDSGSSEGPAAETGGDGHVTDSPADGGGADRD